MASLLTSVPTSAAAAAAPEPAARLRDVVARRDGRPVLRVDRLDIPAAAVTAVVGPNGSGKSTLLHVLSGRVVPETGAVDVRAETRLLPQVGVVEVPRGAGTADEPGAAADLGLLAWFRAQTDLPEAEARTLLAHYRLGSEAIDRPLARLSPGERARVHVAAIVGGGAELILLDEPTNHLDFDTLEVIEAALRAYRGTLVIATHDRALLDAVDCDRVVEVRDGEVG